MRCREYFIKLISIIRRYMYIYADSSSNVKKLQNPVSAECQTLWDHRGHLEQLSALGISDPSSNSTSFESYSESVVAGLSNIMNMNDFKLKRRAVTHSRFDFR